MPLSLASSKSSRLTAWRGTWVNKMIPICVQAFKERSTAVFRREKVETDRITIFEQMRAIGFSVDDVGQTKIPPLNRIPSYTDSPQEVRHLIEKLFKKLKLPSDPRSCLDYLVRVGDLKENVNVELHKQGLMSRSKFPSHLEEFADELLQSFQAKALPITGRCDMRHRGRSIAIDRKNTYCVEQAIDYDQDEQCIFIHLPDVLSFLDPENEGHQALLTEAEERIKRLHYGDFFSPMFPEKLTNQLFSLTGPRKENYTYAITIMFEILSGGRIGKKFEIMRTIIKTPIRFTPNELNRFMDNDFWTQKKYHDMYEFTRLYLEARHKMNGNELGMKELTEKSPAEVLVNELMTVVNTLGAGIARRKNLPYVYRTMKFDDTQVRQRRHSIGFKTVTQEASITAMNTMMNGIPCAVPKPHVDLGVSEYGQLTAPARSYQCFINIYQLLHHEYKESLLYTQEDIVKLVKETLKLERRERIVDRRLQKYRAYRRLANRISESEAGFIREIGVIQDTEEEYVDREKRKRAWAVFLMRYRVTIAAIGPENLEIGSHVHVAILSVDERTSYVKAVIKSVKKRKPIEEDQESNSSSEGAGSIFQSQNSFIHLSKLGDKMGPESDSDCELKVSKMDKRGSSMMKPPRLRRSSRMSTNNTGAKLWSRGTWGKGKSEQTDKRSTRGSEVGDWSGRREVTDLGLGSRRGSLRSNSGAFGRWESGTIGRRDSEVFERRDSSRFRESLGGTDRDSRTWRNSGHWQAGGGGRRRDLDRSWRGPEEKTDGFADETY